MWQALVNQLQAAGFTQSEIGERTGLSQPAISNMARGTYKHGPRGNSALKLIRLAERIKAKRKKR